MNIREHVPLGSHTTFEIGGKARYYTEVKTEDGIREAVAWAQEKNVRFITLAGGSNVLLPDEDLDALVICIASDTVSFRGNVVEADAGVNLIGLIREAAARGLGGWEKLAGIPGSVGGAVRGNAGAFGPEIKDFVTIVRALNSSTNEVRQFSTKECDFTYRHSYFKDHPEWIVTLVEARLAQVGHEESLLAIETTIAEREKRHIQNVRAAGSFFVNPMAPRVVREQFEREKGVQSREGRVPAGWLIEKIGMKGARVGDALASPQHPNYLMNAGNAHANDVRKLAQMIKDAVEEKFGITLEEEAAVFS